MGGSGLLPFLLFVLCFDLLAFLPGGRGCWLSATLLFFSPPQHVTLGAASTLGLTGGSGWGLNPTLDAASVLELLVCAPGGNGWGFNSTLDPGLVVWVVP